MTERDMEQLLRELLEECDNDKFINDVSTFKEDAWGNEKTKKHGLIITTPDGSWFFVTIEKVL